MCVGIHLSILDRKEISTRMVIKRQTVRTPHDPSARASSLWFISETLLCPNAVTSHSFLPLPHEKRNLMVVQQKLSFYKKMTCNPNPCVCGGGGHVEARTLATQSEPQSGFFLFVFLHWFLVWMCKINVLSFDNKGLVGNLVTNWVSFSRRSWRCGTFKPVASKIKS